jgi:hypothetical protein
LNILQVCFPISVVLLPDRDEETYISLQSSSKNEFATDYGKKGHQKEKGILGRRTDSETDVPTDKVASSNYTRGSRKNACRTLMKNPNEGGGRQIS